MTLIDLDQPPAEAGRREPGRGGRIAGTVALMLVAAGLGGFAAYRWQEQRSRSAVQIVVLADLSPAPGSDAISGGAGKGQVTVISHLDVVNTGPAPVRLVALNIAALGMKPGAWMGAEHLIAPGQVWISTIVANIDCKSDLLLRSAPAVAEVVTADGVRRRVAATVDAGAWTEQVTQVCSMS
jgi:hypothetical protein